MAQPESPPQKQSWLGWSLLGVMILLLMIGFFYVSSVSTRWVHLMKTDADNLYFVDAEHLVRNGDKVTYWVRVDIAAQRYKLDGQKIAEVVEAREGTCAGPHTHHSLKRMYMAENVGIVRIEQPPQADILKEPPEAAEAIFSYVCNRSNVSQ
jgi:uncharacterized protein (UPF0212 family)